MYLALRRACRVNGPLLQDSGKACMVQGQLIWDSWYACALQGPLIKAVPGTRAQGRQESFRVETSWLAVADVSFADMLQVVDVAASRQGQQSRPCNNASTGARSGQHHVHVHSAGTVPRQRQCIEKSSPMVAGSLHSKLAHREHLTESDCVCGNCASRMSRKACVPKPVILVLAYC